MPCTNPISGPLLIRYDQNDTGSRPLGDTVPFWNSPDLWLEHPNGSNINEATAKVNVTSMLKVLVRNIGQTTVNNVTVEGFVCDYTQGVNPSTAILGTTKFVGSVGSIGGTAPNNKAVISCTPTWTPTQQQLDPNNTGATQRHLCMFANCFSDTDGQSVDFLDFSTGPSKPPIFRCDSHLAQRNLTLVAASKAVGLKAIDVEFQVANPNFDEAIVVNPLIDRVVGAGAFGKSERWLFQTSPLVAPIKVNGRTRFVLANLSEPIFRNRAAEKKTDLLPEDVFLVRPSRFRRFNFEFMGEDFEPGQIVKFPLEPQEKKSVTARLQLNPDEPVGALRTFDITQKAEDGLIIGGVRVVVVVTP